jgi:diguanylate cyclase (GGDEF)-like protein
MSAALRFGRVSLAGPFVVAAALAGGPLPGACAGALIQVLAARAAWRKRSGHAIAGTLQGFLVGVVGEQFAHRGVPGSVAVTILGLLAGFALSAAMLGPVRRGAWRAIVAGWLLAAPPLVVFVYLFPTTPPLALTLAAGLLLVLAAGLRGRARLERALAEERSRARVDALTNAPNRYALAEALTVEQARIRRGGRPAAVCFLDLDRFKSVNDTYGYAAGDRLLVDVYARLRNELRTSDLVFRWGGEEFVVLAPQVERAELADFAERLRLLTATRPFSIDGKPRRITASVGAVLLDGAHPPEAALERAGKLVRKAKEIRNSAVADPAIPQPSSPARRPREDDRRIERYLAAR